jgi:ankyrin repeat protein
MFNMFDSVPQLGYNLGSVSDITGQTLLHNAAHLQDIDVAEILLQLRASLLIKDSDAHTLLHTALASKRGTTCRSRTPDTFLERDYGEQLNSQDKEGRTALHCVLADSDTLTAVALARYLIARWFNVLVKDHHGDIPLNVAIRNHSADLDLQMLLRTRPGEQLSCKDDDCQTPLQKFSSNGPQRRAHC